MLFTFEMKLLL